MIPPNTHTPRETSPGPPKQVHPGMLRMSHRKPSSGRTQRRCPGPSKWGWELSQCFQEMEKKKCRVESSRMSKSWGRGGRWLRVFRQP